MKKYGRVIFALRKKNNLTQQQLGEKLNVSYQAVSKWENNLSEPDLETIEKLADVFNISMSEFFDLASGIENADNNSKLEINSKNAKINEKYAENNEKIAFFIEKCLNFIKKYPLWVAGGRIRLTCRQSLFARREVIIHFVKCGTCNTQQTLPFRRPKTPAGTIPSFFDSF